MGRYLDVRRHDDAGVPVVVLSGSLSLGDVPALVAALVAALQGRGRVAVCDARGLHVDGDSLLVAFPTALRRAGGWPAASLRLVVEDGSELAERLLLRRTARYLPVQTTIESALAAARAEVRVGVAHLTLPAAASSVSRARRVVEQRWPAAFGGREEAVLVTGELASNAVRHTEHPFDVDLVVSAGHALVAVTDTTRSEPVVREAGPEQPGGRGLRLVAGLALDWGVRWVHPQGKTVWATLPRPSPVPAARRPG